MGWVYEYLWHELDEQIRKYLEGYGFSEYSLKADEKTKDRLEYGADVPITGMYRGWVEVEDGSGEVYKYNVLYEVKWLGVDPDDMGDEYSHGCDLKSIWMDGKEEPQPFFKLDAEWGEDYYLGGYRQYETSPLYKIRITDDWDEKQQTIVER